MFSAFIIILFIYSVVIFRQARGSSIELGERNIYLYSVAIFFFFLGISFIIRTYFMFILPDSEVQFIHNLTHAREGDLIKFFWQIHMFFSFLGIGILMIGVEKNVFNGKTKYMIALATLIFNIFIIALPYDVIHKFHYPLLMTPIILFFAYLYVGLKGTGQIKKNSFVIVFGFLIFFIGILLNSTTVREILGILGSTSITAIISPLVLIIGFTLLARGFQNKF